MNATLGSRLLCGLLCALITLVASASPACPFCKSLRPTLSQRIDAAQIAVLGERKSDKSILAHHVLRGKSLAKPGSQLPSPDRLAAKTGTLLLLLGSGPADASLEDLKFSAVPLAEASYSYVARAPSPKKKSHDRLRYFARYLEHADELIAEDAYQEFGHADYDEVAAVRDVFLSSKLRTWLADEATPQARRGFYALALALAKEDTKAKPTNAQFLRAIILRPADDFRAGFDGVLGGYLIAAGEPALKLIEDRYLANPEAAVGDVRHAIAALRFYQEYGRAVETEKLAAALQKLLVRPEFAAEVIPDLARWKDWSSLETVASLYEQRGYTEPEIRRAIIGYLLVCPESSAARHLARLRRLDPRGVAAAEKTLSATVVTPE
jgi:hypothetical protein